MRKRIVVLLVLAVLLLAGTAAADDGDRIGPALQTEDHIPYMKGNGDGSFAPAAALTRAGMASILSTLTADEGDGSGPEAFDDVPENAWYHDAVIRLSSRGIMTGFPDETFRPGADLSRAEFVATLARFFPEEEGESVFPDVPDAHWAAAAIRTAAEKGWISGYPDGTFRPNQAITRAEAASALNTALGRSAELSGEVIRDTIHPFSDVRPSDWFYAAVVEASTEHTYTIEEDREVWTDFTYDSCGEPLGIRRIGNAFYQLDANGQIDLLPPGLQHIGGKTYRVAANGSIPFPGPGPAVLDGELYCFRDDGSILAEGSEGVLYFGADGRYTCGDSAIDEQTKKLLAQCVKPGMSREQQLRAAYLYLRNNCKYISRSHHERGTTDWLQESAMFWFENRKGNCYCYAAVMMYLARQLGFQAQPVSGGVREDNFDHAWVMIDGHLFDPEYEGQRSMKDKIDYNLYDIDPGEAPFLYYFP